jgi:thioredoxin 1
MGSILEDLLVEIGEGATITKLNVDEHPDIAVRYDIQSIPTILIFKEGKVMDRVVGTVPKKVLAQRLAALTQSA